MKRFSAFFPCTAVKVNDPFCRKREGGWFSIVEMAVNIKPVIKFKIVDALKKGLIMKGKKKESQNKEIQIRVAQPREISKREREVLKLIAIGFKNREISEELGISIKTVETHRANIMNKLALRNVAQLIHYAIRKGFVSVEKE